MLEPWFPPSSQITFYRISVFGLMVAPGVAVPHQGALCRLLGVRSLLFLNRKTEKPPTQFRGGSAAVCAVCLD